MPGRRIFTDAELMAMYQKHLAGMSVRDVAIEADVEAAALRLRWWRFLGVRPVRPPPILKSPGRKWWISEEESRITAEKRNRGIPMQVICAEHHRAQQTLYKAWKRFGIEIRRYYRFHSISEEESRITAEKRNRGVPMRVICAEYHRTHATLHGAWKRDGIKIRRYNPGRTNEK